jgi:hypothetical protein
MEKNVVTAATCIRRRKLNLSNLDHCDRGSLLSATITLLKPIIATEIFAFTERKSLGFMGSKVFIHANGLANVPVRFSCFVYSNEI